MILVEDVNKIEPGMIITFNAHYSFDIGIIKVVAFNNFRVRWCSDMLIDIKHTSRIYDAIVNETFSVYKMVMDLERLKLYNTLFDWGFNAKANYKH